MKINVSIACLPNGPKWIMSEMSTMLDAVSFGTFFFY